MTLADIEQANRIAHEVLGRSLDELPPQTRRLLKLIDAHVAAQCERRAIRRADFRFSRRALREHLAWGDTQLKVHLARLVELEYLVAHRTKTGGFEYELVYEASGDGDTLRFPGLADIETLACAYDAARSGPGDGRSGAGRPLAGTRSAGGRVVEIPANADQAGLAGEIPAPAPKKHVSGANGRASYPQAVVA